MCKTHWKWWDDDNLSGDRTRHQLVGFLNARETWCLQLQVRLHVPSYWLQEQVQCRVRGDPATTVLLAGKGKWHVGFSTGRVWLWIPEMICQCPSHLWHDVYCKDHTWHTPGSPGNFISACSFTLSPISNYPVHLSVTGYCCIGDFHPILAIWRVDIWKYICIGLMFKHILRMDLLPFLGGPNPPNPLWCFGHQPERLRRVDRYGFINFRTQDSCERRMDGQAFGGWL